jgi:lipoprotein NlpI
MNRILALWFALAVVLNSPAAESPESMLRGINALARTNFPAALALCDRAVAAFPSNAMPLSVRSQLLNGVRRYNDAIRDLTAALKLEPKRASHWQGRGEMNFKAGHFKESVADFDRVIEFAPDQAPHHWQRGISLFYARRFTDGRKQFESHLTVNPNDVENAAWHFLCAARETSVTNARAIILPVGPDGRVPMKEVDALYRGHGTVEQVLAAARTSRSRDGMFYAHLYLGLYYDVLGDSGKAREHIKQAAEDPTSSHYMGDVARVHWRTLNAQSR